jgi:hypothetical protein
MQRYIAPSMRCSDRRDDEMMVGRTQVTWPASRASIIQAVAAFLDFVKCAEALWTL